ncbi:hypothetical protein H920_00122 [Fukomys damarensis]|uniref:Uncharacterized protein n=1 Tax=Fukomys damarensis TaxID=885580 RepID=A0A091E6S2_FUKDA|nr:hypothetical protein H920_00122 [Fukomys damarensis]
MHSARCGGGNCPELDAHRRELPEVTLRMNSGWSPVLRGEEDVAMGFAAFPGTVLGASVKGCRSVNKRGILLSSHAPHRRAHTQQTSVSRAYAAWDGSISVPRVSSLSHLQRRPLTMQPSACGIICLRLLSQEDPGKTKLAAPLTQHPGTCRPRPAEHRLLLHRKANKSPDGDYRTITQSKELRENEAKPFVPPALWARGGITGGINREEDRNGHVTGQCQHCRGTVMTIDLVFCVCSRGTALSKDGLYFQGQTTGPRCQELQTQALQKLRQQRFSRSFVKIQNQRLLSGDGQGI